MRLIPFILFICLCLASCASDGSGSSATFTIESTVLVAGGGYAGECSGYCRLDIELSGDGRIVGTRGSWGELPDVVNSGSLTAAGRSELAQIVQLLDGVTLSEQYGCPDCNDGGASFVVLMHNGSRVRSTYESAKPPGPLADTDDFLRSLRLAVIGCESSARITIAADCILAP